MSTIIEKEKQLLKAMQEQNFQPFFEGDKDDAFETIGTALDSIPTYQNTVIRMTATQPIIYARYEGQELRDKIANLDTSRKLAHESAIANLTMLNRICDAYGTERIADIDTKDRYQVADFVGQYCAEVYETGKSTDPGKQNIKTMDTLMEHRAGRRDEYPTNSASHLRKLKLLESVMGPDIRKDNDGLSL